MGNLFHFPKFNIQYGIKKYKFRVEESGAQAGGRKISAGRPEFHGRIPAQPKVPNSQGLLASTLTLAQRTYFRSIVYMGYHDPWMDHFSTPNYILFYCTLLTAYHIFASSFVLTPRRPKALLQDAHARAAHGNKLLTSGRWQFAPDPACIVRFSTDDIRDLIIVGFVEVLDRLGSAAHLRILSSLLYRILTLLPRITKPVIQNLKWESTVVRPTANSLSCCDTPITNLHLRLPGSTSWFLVQSSVHHRDQVGNCIPKICERGVPLGRDVSRLESSPAVQYAGDSPKSAHARRGIHATCEVKLSLYGNLIRDEDGTNPDKSLGNSGGEDLDGMIG
ncbi:hypothetical protein BDV93DRAFT_512180 [Ceratobasidium sp. AG-I]|nr:hypothetical protein BDV93DRAFT_512180 [Ceratobasidium sp. AG-I]